MVAAPTTSLPEWIGGGRNWDYRYAWTRDASLAIRANNLIGYADRGPRVLPLHARGGRPRPRPPDHVRARRRRASPRSRSSATSPASPARARSAIGNGAKDQLQLDTAGALVDAAHLYEHFGGSLSLRAWRKIRAVVEGARQLADEPDHGIWEPRTGRRHNVHSKLMSWLALDRGASLAAIFGEEGLRARWLAHATTLHAEIRARGLDPTKRHFVTAYGDTSTDARPAQHARCTGSCPTATR